MMPNKPIQNGKRLASIAALFFCASLPTLCQGKTAGKAALPLDEQWTRLMDTGKVAGAKALCAGWVESADLTKRVSAEKCLANVALRRGQQMRLEGNETGGGSLGAGFTTQAVDDALKHLNKGIALAPQDLSLHQGRLHVLEVSRRFAAMLEAIDESATIYTGSDAPDVWLAYSAELADMGEPTAGLKFCEVLDKHYPNNSDIIGNIGAFHSMLNQWDLGLPYVRKAAEMHPTDPIDTWNLGWTLNHLDKLEEADKWLALSLQLDPKATDLPERSCLYGHFLITKRKKVEAGCKMVKANCEAADQDVCTAD
jgi:tetratricopeptide (TPR) repeat protein